VQDSVDLAPDAVVQNWKSLEYCSPRLRADPETVNSFTIEDSKP